MTVPVVAEAEPAKRLPAPAVPTRDLHLFTKVLLVVAALVTLLNMASAAVVIYYQINPHH